MQYWITVDYLVVVFSSNVLAKGQIILSIECRCFIDSNPFFWRKIWTQFYQGIFFVRLAHLIFFFEKGMKFFEFFFLNWISTVFAFFHINFIICNQSNSLVSRNEQRIMHLLENKLTKQSSTLTILLDSSTGCDTQNKYARNDRLLLQTAHFLFAFSL